MTESNFAASSARAAVKIVLTVSMTCCSSVPACIFPANSVMMVKTSRVFFINRLLDFGDRRLLDEVSYFLSQWTTTLSRPTPELLDFAKLSVGLKTGSPESVGSNNGRINALRRDRRGLVVDGFPFRAGGCRHLVQLGRLDIR